MAFDDLEMQLLHWNAEEGRWIEGLAEEWDRWRNSGAKRIGLLGAKSNMHHFVFVVYEGGSPPLNIIHHQYLFDDEGEVVDDNRAGLTADEKAEYSRIMRSVEEEPGDSEKLNRIREKLAFADNLPPEAHSALWAALRASPEEGSAAEKFMAKSEGARH